MISLIENRRFHLNSVLFILLLLISAKGWSQPTLTWAKQIGGSGYDLGKSIVVDNAGNTYSTGYFQGTVDFDPSGGVFNLTSNGNEDIFITKLNPLGNLIWAKQIGGGLDDMGKSIALDAVGNIYVTGYFRNVVDFDPNAGIVNITPEGARDIFILKLDASGNFIWVKNMGGVHSDEGTSISIDGAGNIYTTGQFDISADFNPSGPSSILNAVGSADVFVCKHDASGNFLWAKNMGASNQDFGRSIDVDATGNVYTTGHFTGTADFDPGVGVYNLTAASVDIFISKLDPSGNFVWAKQIGGISVDEANSIAIDNVGNIFITGKFVLTVDFDPNVGVANLTSSGMYDIFVSKLDPSGNYLGAIRVGGADKEIAYSLTLNAAGDVFIMGSQKTVGNVDYDPSTSVYNLNNTGTEANFIAQYDNNLGFICAFLITPGNQFVNENRHFDVSGNNLYLITSFGNQNADFEPCTGVYNLPNNGNLDIAIARYDISQCNCALPTTLVANFSVSDSTICVGDCIDFTDLSTGNPSTWEWSFFGAVTTTSSLQNPTNICYNTVGSFDVQLIVSNGVTLDTLLMPNFITVTAPVTPTFNAVTPICSGDFLAPLPTTSNNGITGTWSPSINNLDTTTYTFTPAISECATPTSLTIIVNPLPNSGTNGATTLCITDTPIDLFSLLGGNPDNNGIWSPSLNSGNSIFNPSIDTDGVYTYSVTNSCGLSSSNINITVLPCDKPTALFVLSDDTICEKECISFTDLSTNGDSWAWTFEGGNPNSSNLQNPGMVCYNSPGTYTVSQIITNSYGADTATLLITVKPTPTVNAGDDKEIMFGDSVILSATGTFGTYTWSPNVELSPCYICPTTTAQPDETTTYIVTLTDANGCTASDNVIVVVNLEFTIYIPNAFTPNSGIYNNTFFVKGIGIKDFKMLIFNRWGEQLYQTDDINKGWDGTYKNNLQPLGVYVYKIYAKDIYGKNHNYIGRVSLIK